MIASYNMIRVIDLVNEYENLICSISTRSNENSPGKETWKDMENGKMVVESHGKPLSLFCMHYAPCRLS